MNNSFIPSEYFDKEPELVVRLKEKSLSPSEAAATLGRVKTKKKAKASRENGRKGGRPKSKQGQLMAKGLRAMVESGDLQRALNS